MRVYPNPASTELNIQLRADMSDEIQIRLVNLLGKIIYENRIESPAETMPVKIQRKYSSWIYSVDIISG